jgi:hypothetical protein
MNFIDIHIRICTYYIQIDDIKIKHEIKHNILVNIQHLSFLYIHKRKERI